MLSQADDFNKAYRLMRQAERFCESGDTANTIFYLDSIKRLYPYDPIVLKSQKFLGDLYLKKKLDSMALNSYLYAFHLVTHLKQHFNKDTMAEHTLRQYQGFEANGNLYLAICRFYLNKNSPDKAWYYLKLGDSAYSTYRDCGNAMLMYKSMVANYYTDYYLLKSDTNKAIITMLDQLLNTNGARHKFIKKLKRLLLLKHSQTEIKQEFEKGLKHLTIIEKDSVQYIALTVFGHNILRNGDGNIAPYEKWFKKDIMIHYLTGKINEVSLMQKLGIPYKFLQY